MEQDQEDKMIEILSSIDKTLKKLEVKSDKLTVLAKSYADKVDNVLE